MKRISVYMENRDQVVIDLPDHHAVDRFQSDLELAAKDGRFVRVRGANGSSVRLRADRVEWMRERSDVTTTERSGPR